MCVGLLVFIIYSIIYAANIIIGFIFPLMRVNGATSQSTAKLNSGGGSKGGYCLQTQVVY